MLIGASSRGGEADGGGGRLAGTAEGGVELLLDAAEACAAS